MPDENPNSVFSRYTALLIQARGVLDLSDSFDLVSNDPASEKAFESLELQYRESSLELVKFCADYRDELIEVLSHEPRVEE